MFFKNVDLGPSATLQKAQIADSKVCNRQHVAQEISGNKVAVHNRQYNTYTQWDNTINTLNTTHNRMV